MKTVSRLLAAIFLLSLPMAAQSDCPCEVAIRTGPANPPPPSNRPAMYRSPLKRNMHSCSTPKP